MGKMEEIIEEILASAGLESLEAPNSLSAKPGAEENSACTEFLGAGRGRSCTCPPPDFIFCDRSKKIRLAPRSLKGASGETYSHSKTLSH
ncbi:Hypothetical protein DEACI_1043 [Acididesulfobacillus acetoxydans]|uniref:Uncharacterized protein n=1 Tax=Acididesulfobacillus acetoxydans TaxID=1561005 RepID=A0A8S0X3V6_9FIRM|nr:Hypothetical protein DEACI_1043 [Acididesulfobacillus acetoxydans]CEJ07912.1 Hypothetical protein DEACI_2384 [Acididesulfobacillus acetoxydans]